jgi:transposase
MCQSVENLEAENQRLREENSELKEKLKQLMNRSSKNSSIPPSSEPKANKDEPINRGGAKNGHAAQIRKLLSLDRVDSIKKYSLDKCLHCKKKELVEMKAPAPFQYIELENGRCLVTQYETKRYRCSSCKKQFSAPLPTGIGPSNYGPNFQAAIGMMTGHFHLSKRDAVEFCDQLFAIAISVGTICKIERRITNSLSKAYDKVREKAQNSEDSIYANETGWRDQRKNCCEQHAVSSLLSEAIVRSYIPLAK